MNVIDTDDYAASGIKTFQFPGGEWHVEVPTWRFGSAHIFTKMRSFNQFGPLLGVISALRSQGLSVHVFAPYLPGLRQDRNPSGNTPLTSRIVGNLLREASSVTTVDPHSRVGLAEFARGYGTPATVRKVPAEVYLPDMLTEKYTHILVPDAGAVERATETAQILGIPNIVKAHKVRDFGTGRLTGFTIEDGLSSDSKNPLPRESRILLADDICDGGGTFLGLLRVLREINYETPIDLFVTHGIFSQGVKVLLGGPKQFNRVITTNSWYDPIHTSHDDYRYLEGGRLVVHDILPYYIGGLTP